MAKAADIKTRTLRPKSSTRKREPVTEPEDTATPETEQLFQEPMVMVRWNGDSDKLFRGQKWEWTFNPGENTLPTRIWRVLQRECDSARTAIAKRELQELSNAR